MAGLRIDYVAADDIIQFHDEDHPEDPCVSCRTVSMDEDDYRANRMYPIRWVVFQRLWYAAQRYWPALTMAQAWAKFEAFLAAHPALADRLPFAGWYGDQIKVREAHYFHLG